VSLRFSKHYTRAEARALLPQIRQWLDQLDDRRAQLGSVDQQLAELLATGHDIGGPVVDQWIRLIADLQTLVRQFTSREIQLKDLDRGLIDFPSILDDREVFLCWERGEPDIEYWHELDTGYSGRAPL
jgi:hypothetical protein